VTAAATYLYHPTCVAPAGHNVEDGEEKGQLMVAATKLRWRRKVWRAELLRRDNRLYNDSIRYSCLEKMKWMKSIVPFCFVLEEVNPAGGEE
jgi:hypothetical protein